MRAGVVNTGRNNKNLRDCKSFLTVPLVYLATAVKKYCLFSEGGQNASKKKLTTMEAQKVLIMFLNDGYLIRAGASKRGGKVIIIKFDPVFRSRDPVLFYPPDPGCFYHFNIEV
jgi:hypothetical protein